MNYEYKDKIYEKAFNVQHILDDMISRRPFATIFILNCCRACEESSSRCFIDRRSRSEVLPRSEQEKPANMSGNQSLILFSCSDGAIADDGNLNEQSSLTKHLLKRIEKPNENVLSIFMNVIKGDHIPQIHMWLTHKNRYLRQLSKTNISEKYSSSHRLPSTIPIGWNDYAEVEHSCRWKQ